VEKVVGEEDVGGKEAYKWATLSVGGNEGVEGQDWAGMERLELLQSSEFEDEHFRAEVAREWPSN
jgi:hypothetical protein